MSEQAKFYEIDRPCNLTGSGHCCKDRHRADIEAMIESESDSIALDSRNGPTTLNLKPESVGKTKLHIHGNVQRWETEISCNPNKIVEDTKTRQLKPTQAQMERILNIASKRLTVHTYTNPDCPLLKLLHEHKI